MVHGNHTYWNTLHIHHMYTLHACAVQYECRSLQQILAMPQGHVEYIQLSSVQTHVKLCSKLPLSVAGRTHKLLLAHKYRGAV